MKHTTPTDSGSSSRLRLCHSYLTLRRQPIAMLNNYSHEPTDVDISSRQRPIQCDVCVCVPRDCTSQNVVPFYSLNQLFNDCVCVCVCAYNCLSLFIIYLIPICTISIVQLNRSACIFIRIAWTITYMNVKHVLSTKTTAYWTRCFSTTMLFCVNHVVFTYAQLSQLICLYEYICLLIFNDGL